MNMIKRIIWFVATMLFRIVRWIVASVWRLVCKKRGKDAHDKVQLWEGGPYWATTNIGAEKPEDFGHYFWWGDTVGYKRENDKWVASDGSSPDFSFGSATTPTYKKNLAVLQDEGWVTAAGVLVPEHDAAHVKWGGHWRMPTKQELIDLYKKCDFAWSSMNGVDGYIVHGRGDFASNSIFLPAGGTGRGSALNDADTEGYYWSSFTRDCASYAWRLFIYSSRPLAGELDRFNGYSIRPVQGTTE